MKMFPPNINIIGKTLLRGLCSNSLPAKSSPPSFINKNAINWDSAMDWIQEQDQVNPPPKTDLRNLENKIPFVSPTFNVASIVNFSPPLRKLVDLGVDLSLWERYGHLDVALKLTDFENDVQPWIQFLLDRGLNLEACARSLSDYPEILRNDLDILNERIHYLESKDFTPEMIKSILVKDPSWLLHSVENIDWRLGYLQVNFKLIGDEVRSLSVKYPSLVTWNGLPTQIRINNFFIHQAFGFDKSQCKKLLMNCPQLFRTEHEETIDKQFNYLHNIVGYSHETLVEFPKALTEDYFKTKPRWEFLTLIGRDQINPKKPNYVSPAKLTLTFDDEFCSQVAKVQLKMYNKFLKTL